jgi:hypothetical protein
MMSRLTAKTVVANLFCCTISKERTGEAIQSGRGLPQSRTLSRGIGPHYFRQVVECGSPLPLFHGLRKEQGDSIGKY